MQLEPGCQVGLKQKKKVSWSLILPTLKMEKNKIALILPTFKLEKNKIIIRFSAIGPLKNMNT